MQIQNVIFGNYGEPQHDPHTPITFAPYEFPPSDVLTPPDDQPPELVFKNGYHPPFVSVPAKPTERTPHGPFSNSLEPPLAPLPDDKSPVSFANYLELF